MKPTAADPLAAFSGDRLSHAYIAPGALADRLAMAAVCSGAYERPCMNCVHCGKASRGIHPDIITVSKLPDRKDIVVEQIRGLKKDVIVVPNEAGKKAYVIDGAERMNSSAQNAFLMMLEEPPPHAVFILKTDTPAGLLPTVRSRCVELTVRTGEESPGGEAAEMAAEFISALSGGNAALAAFMFRLERLDRVQFALFLSAVREKAAAQLRVPSPGDDGQIRKSLSRIEKTILKAGDFLDLNVNVGHIAGMICASLILT